MQRILAATDGSPDGQAAVRWSSELASATAAELVVATAWRPQVSEVSPDDYEALRAGAQTTLAEWCAAVLSPNRECRRVVLEGDPRDTLVNAAEELDVDLLVIGTRGTGRRHHALHLGSVAHHLVHKTARPLAVTPVSARAVWPSPIVVGLDGSTHSNRALEFAVGLAGSVASDVVAVYAEAPPAEFVPHDDPKSWFHRAQRELDKWVAPQAKPGLALRCVVVDHEPGPGLAEAGEREAAGLIVVGARGIGEVSGVRLGGTALKVLHHSQLPVVIIP